MADGRKRARDDDTPPVEETLLPDEGTNTRQEQPTTTCSTLHPVGCNVFHKLLSVHGIVAQHASAADFLHKGKVLIKYAATEKKQQVVKSLWCTIAELEVAGCKSPAEQEAVAPRSVVSVRPFARPQVVDVEEDEEVVDTSELEAVPELAALERGRMIPQKRGTSSSGTSWGVLGIHKTASTKVPLDQRVSEFPDNALTVAASTRGKTLFCRCCKKELQNILGTIKTHISSERHKENLQRWVKRNKGDNQIATFLHEHFKQHPDEKDSSVGEEVQLFRWRVVEACLYSGVPMRQVDSLRELLERGGHALTSSEHLAKFIPKIEAFEFARIVNELKGQKVCLIYDGTTRHGECTAVLMRWCTDSFEIQQRLIALRTVAKHMNGDNLGPFLIDLIGQVGVRSASVICTARDSCSTNGKAERNIKHILNRASNLMCVSHTLSHTAEHIDLPVIKEFMTPWLSLVQHHPAARNAWKQLLGGSMKGFSTIRWFSREELCNELAVNFGLLPSFVESLVADEIGDAHTKKMHEILRTQGDVMQLELACTLDAKPTIATCYSLEGDGLCILLARRKLDELISWGTSIGDRAESMPNVAALLRARAELKPGVKIYEYFTDINPPKWFAGEVVQPRQPNLITVKYADNSKIDQEEREVRQWVDVRELPEWKRLAAAVKSGIQYLRNRMDGNLPAGQRNYDCSKMFEVLEAVQIFDPSWAANNMTAASIDALAVVPSLEQLLPGLHLEQHAFLSAAKSVTIDHTENKDDHTFTHQVLKFYRERGKDFPTWAEAATIVFAFTPNSAAAERVFSLVTCMFGDNQSEVLGDYLQAAVMLRYNKRTVG